MVMVLPCGQFRPPIQRLYLTSVVVKPLRSNSHRRNNPLSKTFSARFSGDPNSGVWTLHQDRWSLRSSPVEDSPKKCDPRASTSRPTRRHCPSRRCVRAHGLFSDHRTSSPELHVTDLQGYNPGFLIQQLHRSLLSIFISMSYIFSIFLILGDF